MTLLGGHDDLLRFEIFVLVVEGGLDLLAGGTGQTGPSAEDERPFTDLTELWPGVEGQELILGVGYGEFV